MMKKITDYRLRITDCIFIVIFLLQSSICNCLFANEDVILKALNDELVRTQKKLQLKNMEKPYFISYTVGDYEYFTVNATLGAKLFSRKDRTRILKVQTRVGNYKFDNTGFIPRRGTKKSFTISSIPEEDNYDAIRQSVWMASDDSYKKSLEVLSGKKAFFENQLKTKEEDDFSKEEPTVLVEEKESFKFNAELWENKVKVFSSLLKKYSKIQKSEVSALLGFGNIYMLTTEKTRYRGGSSYLGIAVRAKTQAKDGMELKNYITFFGITENEIPSDEFIKKEIEKMASDLSSLVNSPLIESYAGPVLFEGQASCEFFRQILGSQLDSSRPAVREKESMSNKSEESELIGRLKTRIMPTFLTVIDDPTLKVYKDKQLFGYYNVDIEGSKSQRILLIDKGTLINMYASRRPRKEFQHSNGHTRGQFYDEPKPRIGNLFIQNSQNLSSDELKKKFLELCRESGNEYGIIIRLIDNPSISGMDKSDFSSFFMGGEKAKLTKPLVAVRVFVKDGREELVRLGEFSELDIRSLKEIVATGGDDSVYNYLDSKKFYGMSETLTLSGIPSSIIAPSFILEDVVIKKTETTNPKLPYIAFPTLK